MGIIADPPELLSQVDKEVRTNRILRADLSCSSDAETFKIGLTACFQRHVFAADPRGGRPYCYAIRSGEISIDIPECMRIHDSGEDYFTYTVGIDSESGREEQTTGDQSISFEAATVKFSGPSAPSTQKSDHRHTESGSYQTLQPNIAVSSYPTGASWVITKPSAKSPTLDYIYKSYELEIEYRGKIKEMRGSLTVRPGCPGVYDPHGRYLSERLAIKSYLLLLIRGIDLPKTLFSSYELNIIND